MLPCIRAPSTKDAWRNVSRREARKCVFREIRHLQPKWCKFLMKAAQLDFYSFCPRLIFYLYPLSCTLGPASSGRPPDSSIPTPPNRNTRIKIKGEKHVYPRVSATQVRSLKRIASRAAVLNSARTEKRCWKACLYLCGEAVVWPSTYGKKGWARNVKEKERFDIMLVLQLNGICVLFYTAVLLSALWLWKNSNPHPVNPLFITQSWHPGSVQNNC